MLAASPHPWKVNFCKFTNETRNEIEDATVHSGQTYLAAVNGTASGGGYELALACEHIMLVDDRSSAVSLPELPLLGVLPGTGGLTRLVDKRGVRRDLADVFATKAEGFKGSQAMRFGLVDEIVPRSGLDEAIRARASSLAALSDRPESGPAVSLEPLVKTVSDDEIAYANVRARVDRHLGSVEITVSGPSGDQPADPSAIAALGDRYWPLAVARELDDLVLHLRFNEPTLGTLVLRTSGDASAVKQVDDVLLRLGDDWLVREIVGSLKRVLKRLDVTSRTLLALIDEESCFTGTLIELALAADRTYMLDADGVTIGLDGMNFGPLPMGNGLTRLASRFIGSDGASRFEAITDPIDASTALDLGLVTFAPDDLDWSDEVRLALEERSSFSPDALTAMEANHRFVGPETMETKIFGRLSCWQNWVFSRPNATGPDGALPRYGTGVRPTFDKERI
jgi:benzoyl-CoA-dihydrodiol lyase